MKSKKQTKTAEVGLLQNLIINNIINNNFFCKRLEGILFLCKSENNVCLKKNSERNWTFLRLTILFSLVIWGLLWSLFPDRIYTAVRKVFNTTGTGMTPGADLTYTRFLNLYHNIVFLRPELNILIFLPIRLKIFLWIFFDLMTLKYFWSQTAGNKA